MSVKFNPKKNVFLIVDTKTRGTIEVEVTFDENNDIVEVNYGASRKLEKFELELAHLLFEKFCE